MRKILFLLSGVLGMLLSTSCGAAYYGNGCGYGYDYYGYGYNSYSPQYYPPVSVRSSRFTPDGTRIVGDKGCPRGLIWANASMVRNGMIVTILGEQREVLAQYDLRVPEQKVDDCFYVTGLTGKQLEVWVVIKGGPGSVNYITVYDGQSKRTYNLRRE